MKLPALIFQKEAFLGFDKILEKEWIITNGLGSYASSTVPGINTRKYHGLLVAALEPPGKRTVCLSKLDEDVLLGNNVFRLGSNEFHDTIYPQGYKLISQFSINPFPKYTYNFEKLQLTKTFFLPQKKNASAAIYKVSNLGKENAKVKIYPLLTCRYYHTVVNQSKVPLNFDLKTEGKKSFASFQRQRATILCMATDGRFTQALNWINQLHYRDELFRGEADEDDCFQPGYFEIPVSAEQEKEFAVTCTIGHDGKEAEEVSYSLGSSLDEVKDSFAQEENLRGLLLSDFYHGHPEVPMSDWLNWILFAADSFMVENTNGRKAVIAGYHWFESWGRDTFVSLPGLFLVAGKFSQSKNILETFNGYCKSGLIPNFISDKSGIPVYDTVDATLWYVNSVLQYIKYTGDFDFVKEVLWPKLQEIIENHQKGTLFGIRADADGFLMHGPRLTWMDASVGKEAITPRTGKAVEIQALWYNALRIMALLADRFSEPTLSEKYSAMANLSQQNFASAFWNPKNNCLFDVVNQKEQDASIRPNQILAISLDYTMLDKEKSRSVVDVVNRELVTPYGLRTLSLGDPKFIGKCSGDSRSRDRAYHNGTIWPWLLGPFVTAYLKVNDYSNQAREQMMQNLILPLFSVGIHQGGLGTINEIYDCDPPNEPRGCISQAWSVAEPLRAYVEDILQVKPKYSENLRTKV